MFCKAEGRQARAFQADARPINDKVRLHACVGAVVIAARKSPSSSNARQSPATLRRKFLSPSSANG